MTDTQPPAAARDAARSEARRMIAGLMPGQTGINLANEIADAVLDAALPAIIAAYEKQKTAEARKDRGEFIGCDFGICNTGEWENLATGRGWSQPSEGTWNCPVHTATLAAWAADELAAES